MLRNNVMTLILLFEKGPHDGLRIEESTRPGDYSIGALIRLPYIISGNARDDAVFRTPGYRVVYAKDDLRVLEYEPDES